MHGSTTHADAADAEAADATTAAPAVLSRIACTKVLALTSYNQSGITSVQAKRRVFGSADHSEADRTLGRAGVARE
jgi:hypothetical protein